MSKSEGYSGWMYFWGFVALIVLVFVIVGLWSLIPEATPEELNCTYRWVSGPYGETLVCD